MAYTPENNPYIPGDPYSYDLKWIVSKLKRFEEALGSELTEAVRELINQVFVDAIYDADTETLIIYLNMEGINNG